MNAKIEVTKIEYEIIMWKMMMYTLYGRTYKLLKEEQERKKHRSKFHEKSI